MPRLHFGRCCPRCRSGKIQRLKRKTWMRWLPASKYYRCRKCRSRFVVIAKRFSLLTG